LTTELSSHEETDRDVAEFLAALELRRKQVYDYLDSWHGATAFQPSDIHDAIYSYLRRQGKALRPLVLLLSCGAVGGDEEQALPAAAAVEVFHTWTLVHDDIIDRDETRRGSPTVHADYRRRAEERFGLRGEEAAHYGRTVAILAGDSQQSWSYALLADLRERGVAAELVLELIKRMAMSLTPALLEGEMLDVQYALMPMASISEERVLEMLSKKTGALLEYAAWCGARIGLQSQQDAEQIARKLGTFASLCGTAFQLHDDALGLTADEAQLGKPVGSDLREGKHTLIVYRALARATPSQRDAILAALGDSGADARRVSEALANSLIARANLALSDLPDTPQRRLLASWANFLTARRY
jgi:geranylgeranyl diphosphate synthase type I